jgi:hypothetical protein
MKTMLLVVVTALGLSSACAGAAAKEGTTVADGLRWLAEHQMPDGGWSFDHAKAPRCKGQCPNPGRAADARVAATSLSVLAFLGAGQTHKVGRYKKTVWAGLFFLVSRMQVGPQAGRLMDKDASVEAQAVATQGHASGSWWMPGAVDARHGGRLHQTALSLLALQVYYRCLPVYRSEAIDRPFPRPPKQEAPRHAERE